MVAVNDGCQQFRAPVGLDPDDCQILAVDRCIRLADLDCAAIHLRQKIVEAGGQVMGGRFDYPHYYALNMIVDTGGGLEHKNSFLVMANRFTTRTRRTYLGYLSLVAHEHFHAWNITRLRPIELGPFDYENENYVKTLWVAEGFTDYYADILPRRETASQRQRGYYFAVVVRAFADFLLNTGMRLPPEFQSYKPWPVRG